MAAGEQAGRAVDTAPGGGPASAALPPERGRAVLRLRLVLGVFWLLVTVVLAVGTAVGPQPVLLVDLYADVASGRVASVDLAPGFLEGEAGSVPQQAVWTVDGRERTARWQAVRGLDGEEVVTSGGEVDLVREDVATRLRTLDPDVRVRVVPAEPDGLVLLGLSVPGPQLLVLGVFLLGWLGTVALLVGGPRPYRASRWAWFWLSAPPLGLLAFVVLSGPTPGLGVRRPSGPGLGGGLALLLSLLLSAVVQPPWWW